MHDSRVLVAAEALAPLVPTKEDDREDVLWLLAEN